jgi:hypothetical protein
MSTQASDVPMGSVVTVTDGKADPQLASIQRLVESSNNYHATRFERKVFNRITDQGTTPLLLVIQRCNACSMDTARVIYSTSYGAYQIMGFNLYSKTIGWQGTVQNYMNDSVAQDNAYYHFLKANQIEYTWQMLKQQPALLNKFAVTYNGSTIYAVALVKAAKELGL